MQDRFESKPIGRALITGLLLFLLTALLASNLPESELKRVMLKPVRALRDSLGLHQTWSVFAPDPSRTTFRVEARIRFADGSAATWRVPSADPVFTQHRVYHWQKFAESVGSDRFQTLWEPFAAWIARRYGREGRRPVEVTLVRRWFEIFPPGSKPARGPWSESAFYTLRLAPEPPGGPASG